MFMSRIYPAAGKNEIISSELVGSCTTEGGGGWDIRHHRRFPSKFTVWKRSSMTFQGTDGFTVFDQHGKLAFRVDNYSRKNVDRRGGGLVLMDGIGNALLTFKSKGLFSMRREWYAYDGDCTGRAHQGQKFRVFSMRKSSTRFSFLGRKSSKHGIIGKTNRSEAEVFVAGSREPEFRIEGSFQRRNCCIRRVSTGEMVAKISRKRANSKVLLGSEVFSLVVQPQTQPGLDDGLIMGFIVVLDRICYKPLLCCCQ